MNIPTIVLVGRPNVGKSTLFNRLTGGRRALMSDIPGTTRDWQEGSVHWNNREFRLVDTGGYAPGDEVIITAVRGQVDRWVKEADLTLWIVEASEGLSPADQTLAGWMRSRAKNVVLVPNKVDDPKREAGLSEFHRLGFDVVPVSASHGRNIHSLLEIMEERCPPPPPEPEGSNDAIKVALVGRPNVGKSSTLNAVLGEERMIVSDIPGTTRDAVDTLIERGEEKFLFIDTAGLRASKSKSAQGLEGLTRIMAEKALDRAEVAVLLVDAAEGIRDGDIAVGRLVDGKNRACVVGVNKWDLVKDAPQTARIWREKHSEDLPFMAHAPIIFYSAKTGRRVPELMTAVSQAHAAFNRVYDREELTAFIWKQIQERPYSHHGHKLVFHGAEQVSTAPTVLTLRGNMTDTEIHFSFRRRLENSLRERYALHGAPLIIKFKRGKR